MAEISHCAVVIPPKGTNFGATPENSSVGGYRQPAQHAQQAGFAAAVGPLNLHQSAGFEGKIDITEQPAVAAHALQVASLQHGHLSRPQRPALWRIDAVRRNAVNVAPYRRPINAVRRRVSISAAHCTMSYVNQIPQVMVLDIAH